MQLRVVQIDELARADLDAWHVLRDENPLFDSPYFHPGFSQAVHASGAEVRVVICARQDGTVVSVLPFHLRRSRMSPVGWPGADFQGPIVRAGSSIDPLAYLAAAGARFFEFDHLLSSGEDFVPWISSRRVSPFIDVSGGLPGYLGRASRSGKDNMGQARRRTAKAERDHGSVTFVADSMDADLLDRLIQFKRAQYEVTGARDYFVDTRRRDLLHRLLQKRESSFGGVLSTLHVGEHLIAAHFGIRAANVLHWWFPVYNPEFAALAPGWMLLRELVTAAPSLGISRIDLGRGDDEYKRRAKTGETAVCQGMVAKSPTTLALRRVKDSSVRAAKHSPIGPWLKVAVRRIPRGR